MTISTTCQRCGAPIQYESGAEVARCGECGAVRAATDAPPTAEVVEEEAELLEPVEDAAPQPVPRARHARPRTDEALPAFATGCYWARAGVSIEALGFVLGLVLFGLAALADDRPPAGRGAPPFVLFPVVCTAVGALLTAWGRSSMLALGTAGGAERVLAFSAALAWFRAALLCFAPVAITLALFGGREYAASLARGAFAVVAAGLLALLSEATALSGLAAAGAARGLVRVRDRALSAVLALQIFGSAALALVFVMTARGSTSKIGFEVVAYGALAAVYLWYMYAQFALYTVGVAVLDTTVGRSRR